MQNIITKSNRVTNSLRMSMRKSERMRMRMKRRENNCLDANARSTVSTVFAMNWLLSRLHSSAVCLSLSLFWSFFRAFCCFFCSFCFCICVVCLEDDFALCQYMNQCGSVGEYYWCVFLVKFTILSVFCRFYRYVANEHTYILYSYIHMNICNIWKVLYRTRKTFLFDRNSWLLF